jgi:hypothetical protein
MLERRSICAITLAAALTLTIGGARAFDDAKYPNWKGQWMRSIGVQWDVTKRPARAQEAPLTPEYQAIYESRLAEQENLGGQDYNPQVRCKPPGLPRAMIGYEPFELIITPDITYMRLDYMQEFRRIHTDGRDRPKDVKPTLLGYSIGKWIDEDGDGRYDVLEVETRGFHGPRVVENTGIPLHTDNQTIIKERIHLDQADKETLIDEITTIDNAFTRPWTVARKFKREAKTRWFEYVCDEHNTLVIIRRETYFIREDGFLMPSRKDQPAPDLKFFGASP